MPNALRGEVYPLKCRATLVDWCTCRVYRFIRPCNHRLLIRLYLYSNIYSTVDSFIAVSEGVYVYNQCPIWLKGKFTYVVNNVYEDVDFIPVAWEMVKKPFCVRPNATFGRQLYALVYNVNSILGNLESVILLLLIRLGNPDSLHYSLREKFGPPLSKSPYRFLQLS